MPTEAFLKHFYESGLYTNLCRGMRFNTDDIASKARNKAVIHADYVLDHTNDKQFQNVLDVGAAEGYFLDQLRSHRPEIATYGIEPGASAYDRVRSSHNKIVSDIQEIDPGIKFDLITIWHVLEHLRDPIAYLQTLRERIAPDGLLLLEVPDARQTIPKNIMIHIGHLYHFAPNTLERIANQSGFTLSDANVEQAYSAYSFRATLLPSPR